MIDITDNEFSLLRSYLCKVCGIEVPPDKRYLFETRLNNLFVEEGYRSFSELHEHLSAAKDRRLQRKLVEAMTTHESSFFRDLHPFKFLKEEFLPRVARQRAQEAMYLPPHLRILSAGCGLGQEAYSIAMCVRDWLTSQEDFAEENVSILGIDVSSRVLDLAKKGVYTQQEMGTSLSPHFRCRHFRPKGGAWELSPQIRDMVSFLQVNLSEPFEHLGKFDLIFCRNVIIYFSTDLKLEVLRQFRRMLRADGALIMGASESIYMLSHEFRVVNEGPTICYAPSGDSGVPVRTAALPHNQSGKD